MKNAQGPHTQHLTCVETDRCIEREWMQARGTGNQKMSDETLREQSSISERENANPKKQTEGSVYQRIEGST